MAQSEQAKQRQDAARKAMEEQREERKKATEQALKRAESTQPTPTQEENDLAKLGIPVENKQDDKSGPTVITTTVVAGEPVTTHGYETEQAREARKKAQQPRQ
jgi:hypothetical protein